MGKSLEIKKERKEYSLEKCKTKERDFDMFVPKGIKLIRYDQNQQVLLSYFGNKIILTCSENPNDCLLDVDFFFPQDFFEIDNTKTTEKLKGSLENPFVFTKSLETFKEKCSSHLIEKVRQKIKKETINIKIKQQGHWTKPYDPYCSVTISFWGREIERSIEVGFSFSENKFISVSSETDPHSFFHTSYRFDYVLNKLCFEVMKENKKIF